jgi:hypothetical protein
MYPISMVILKLYINLINFSKKTIFCTDITYTYLYLTCSIDCGVKLYLDLWNVNKFNSIHQHSAFIFKEVNTKPKCFIIV